MNRILFVCHGNICRSPMAQMILQDMVRRCGLTHAFQIDSAATSDEEIYAGRGNPIYPPARRELARHGITCLPHEARQVCKNDYTKFDRILAMDHANLRNLQRLFQDDPDGKVCLLLQYTGQDRDVADPWYSGDFARAYDDIYAGCEALLATLLDEAKGRPH